MTIFIESAKIVSMLLNDINKLFQIVVHPN